MPEIIDESTVFMDNNNVGKPQGIELMINNRPSAVFNTVPGDQQRLKWTGAGNRATCRMLVHHDDSVHEYAYGSASGVPNIDIGVFTDALRAEANDRGWSVTSMKDDWPRVVPRPKTACSGPLDVGREGGPGKRDK